MSKGARIRLSNGRRLVDDVIRVARRQPMAAFTRDMDLRVLCDLRRQIKPRISWNAIMMKAYSMVAVETPELRQVYVGLPWPHIYQAAENVAMITVAREDQQQTRLLFARFNRPECSTLSEIQAQLDRYNTAPIDSIKQFRHQIRFAAMPTFLRRMVWFMMNDIWPSKRASHVGTFGMSISGFNSAYGNAHLGPNATILGVDPAPRNGIARTMLTFDHRILDGKPTIDVISKLYRTLMGPIQEEMQTLTGNNSKSANAA